MHYLISDGRSDQRKCYSLGECDDFARECGEGTYNVVAVSKRLGMDHESWLWGRVVLARDGSLSRIKIED